MMVEGTVPSCIYNCPMPIKALSFILFDYFRLSSSVEESSMNCQCHEAPKCSLGLEGCMMEAREMIPKEENSETVSSQIRFHKSPILPYCKNTKVGLGPLSRMKSSAMYLCHCSVWKQNDGGFGRKIGPVWSFDAASSFLGPSQGDLRIATKQPAHLEIRTTLSLLSMAWAYLEIWSFAEAGPSCSWSRTVWAIAKTSDVNIFTQGVTRYEAPKQQQFAINGM